MPERFTTTPFGEEPDGGFTFSDATLLALLGVAALALAAVFLLGASCAERRIAAAVTAIEGGHGPAATAR